MRRAVSAALVCMGLVASPGASAPVGLRAEMLQGPGPQTGDGSKDYEEAYRKGIQNLELGNFREAADMLLIAVKARSATNEQVRLYGRFYEKYTPNYLLSVALVKAGDCSGARERFAQAEPTVGSSKLKKQEEVLAQRCR